MKISRIFFSIALLALLWPVSFALTQATPNMRFAAASPGGSQPTVFYVTVKGTRQGNFKGESLGNAHRDQIEGLRFAFQVSSPRDSATGQATGRRQYTAVLFTKEWGAASPQFLTAAATNEVLQTVEFQFMHTNPMGQERVFETVTLTQATVAGVRQYLGVPSVGDPADPRPLEDITLSFRKIEVTNNDGRTVFVDDITGGI